MGEHSTITTERLTIREIDEKNALKVTETVNDGDSMTASLESNREEILQEMEKDLDAVIALIDLMTSLRDSSDMRRYGAWNEHGELVAYVGATSWSTGTPELQITVAADYQRRGYGTELLSGLLPWLFEHEDIDHFVYRLRYDNEPSERIAVHLGGVLQKPQSRIEELNIKTYNIYPQKQPTGNEIPNPD